MIAPLPRPCRIGNARSGDAPLPRADGEVFAPGALRVAARLCAWLAAAARLLAGIGWDRLRRRDSEERRAARLRALFEGAGAAWIKLGQQLSVRMDLIPYAYVRELEKMLEDVPPFPVEQAVAAVERAAGRPLAEAYAVFDPDPVGSASIACVYQAVLRDGRKVAVKVRRPGIGLLLAADLRALGWVLWLLELFWLPPGFSRNFLGELRAMLLAELDLAKEARFTELFRRSAEAAKLGVATAPRVYFELSDRDVLVAEFVAGVWVSDLLRIVEQRDQAALAALRQSDIDPAVVARHYLQAHRFGGFEGLFFHADLHPGNVVVQPGNRLVLIDFGSCGFFSRRDLRLWLRLTEAQRNRDVAAMAQAALGLMEPLPPIDVDELERHLEAAFWENLITLESGRAEWWERTSGPVWVSFFKLARRYEVPMNLNVLRMVRATLLSETVAVRLDPELDPYREFLRFEQSAGRRASRRLRERLRRTFLGPESVLRWEQLLDSGLSAVFRAQRLLDGSPLVVLTAQMDKAAYAFKLLLDLLLLALVAAAVLALAGLLGRAFGPGTVDPLAAARAVLDSPWYLGFLALVTLVAARRLWYRLRAKEKPRSNAAA